MRALVLLGLAGLAAAAAGGCAVIYGYGDYTDQSDGGTVVRCAVAEECPGEDNECSFRVCDNGTCTRQTVAANEGASLSEQQPEDCMVRRCRDGAIAPEVDATDPRSDGRECTLDECAPDGQFLYTPQPGAACGQGSNTQCDASGNCVGCVMNEDCGVASACVTLSCDAGTCIVGAAPVNTLCSPLQCSGDDLYPDAFCDGAGTCLQQAPSSCFPYTCTGTACVGSCTTDAECAVSARCMAGSTCVDCVSCPEWYITPTFDVTSPCATTEPVVAQVKSCACSACAADCTDTVFCSAAQTSTTLACYVCIEASCSNEFGLCGLDTGH